MTNTPETDNLARGNHVVPTEFAQELERQRDEARAALADEIERGRVLRGLLESEGNEWCTTKERDQWRECAEMLILYAREARNKAWASDKWEFDRINADVAQYERLKEAGK